MRDGIRSEHGKMVYPDQTVYEGLWVAGLKCGMGVLLLPDASRYRPPPPRTIIGP